MFNVPTYEKIEIVVMANLKDGTREGTFGSCVRDDKGWTVVVDDKAYRVVCGAEHWHVSRHPAGDIEGVDRSLLEAAAMLLDAEFAAERRKL